MKCWWGLSPAFLLTTWTWLMLLTTNTMAQEPGRNCLALCAVGNLTCVVGCAQCDYNCCSSLCNATAIGNTCSRSCFPTTLNHATCCTKPATPSAPPPPPAASLPYAQGPGNCTFTNIPASPILVAGTVFGFNITAVTCNFQACAICNITAAAFTGPALYFTATILDSATNLPVPATTCNVTTSAMLGLYKVACLSQVDYEDSASNYTLALKTVSYGIWSVNTRRSLQIIPGPISVPDCIAEWDRDISTFAAGSLAVLRIIQKDRFNNTVSARNGRADILTFYLSGVHVAANGSKSLYNETYTLSYNVSRGVQTITFVPRRLGTFYLQIGNHTHVVQKSPFRYDVGPGALSTSSSLALWPTSVNTFPAGSRATFAVYSYDVAGNPMNTILPFDVFFIDGGVHNPFTLAVLQFPQNWSVSFTPVVAGRYMVHIGNGSTALANSPLWFSVVSGPVVVPRCTGQWVNDISSYRAGDQGSFVVKQMDAYNNNVSLQTGSLDAHDFNATVQNVADGSLMSSSWVVLKPPVLGSAFRVLDVFPRIAGNFQMIVGDDHDTIQGSPFPLEVLPGPISVYHCVASFFWGNITTVGSYVSISIQKRDVYDNSVYEDCDFNYAFFDNLGQEIHGVNASILKDSSLDYDVLFFLATIAGSMTIRIGGNDQTVVNSPLVLQVNGGPVYIPSCIATWRYQSSTFVAGAQALLDVALKDVYNNTLSQANGGFDPSFSLWITMSSNANAMVGLAPFNVTMNFSTQGFQTISFFPITVGQYYINVMGPSNDTLPSSPFAFTVIAGRTSPANCSAKWRGGSTIFQAGVKSTVDIYLMDQFSNVVNSTNGRNESVVFNVQVVAYRNMLDWNMTMEPTTYSGYQTVNFYPPITGNFLMQISSNSINISGSPYPFTVKPGPLDISKSQGQWPFGIQYFTLNGTIRFHIFARDKFGNPILSTDVDPSEFTGAVYNSDLTTLVMRNIVVSRFNATTLALTFSMGTVGQYILQVGNVTEDIIGSPYVFYIATDVVSPSRSIMDGDGLRNSTYGNTTTILIQFRDTSGQPAAANIGDVTVQLFLGNVSMNFNMSITPIAQTIGVFVATYTGMAIGNFLVYVKWKGIIIGTGIPVAKTIFPGSVSLNPQASKVVGNTTGGVAGAPQSYQVTMVDNFDMPFAGVVTVNFSSGANAKVSITNTQTGTYLVVYNITKAGTFNMTILVGKTVATVPINGSPFKVVIAPGPLSIPHCVGVWKSNLAYTSVSQDVSMEIGQRDEWGNPIWAIQNNATAHLFWGSVYRHNGTFVPTPRMFFRIYNSTPSDWYDLRFSVPLLGSYYLNVYSAANLSVKIKGSPYSFTMVQEPPNATYSILYGNGLQDTVIYTLSMVYVRLYDQYNASVVGNFQGTNSMYLTVTVMRVLSGLTTNLTIFEDADNPGNYTTAYTPVSVGPYSVRITWVHPVWKTIFLGMFNVTVAPAVMALECKAWDPGSAESVTAYQEFDLFTNRHFSYDIQIRRNVNSTWHGTLQAENLDGASEQYSVRLYMEKSSHSRVFRLPALNNTVVLTRGLSSGFTTTFLKFITRWNNVFLSTKDEQGNPIFTGSELAGFTILGGQPCRSLTMVGQKYLTSRGVDKYVISMAHGGSLLRGSPFTIAIARGIVQND